MHLLDTLRLDGNDLYESTRRLRPNQADTALHFLPPAFMAQSSWKNLVLFSVY